MSRWYKSSKYFYAMFRNMAKRATLDEAPHIDFSRFVNRRLIMGVFAIGILGHNTVEMNTYTRKIHFVVVPKCVENKLGEWKIERIKEEFKEFVLPQEHPHTMRVRTIAKNMIESPIFFKYGPQSSLASQCPKYLNSEVIVIDMPIVKACCYAGKIVIFTGLLDRLESDAEIATVVGHEVGHDFARHAAAKITKIAWVSFFRLFIWCFLNLVGCEIHYKIIKHPSFKKIEREADYLGGILMATGGYDPSVAPRYYARLSKDVEVSDNCSIVPTGTKRATLLSRPEVMGDLMFWYNYIQQQKLKSDQLIDH